MIHGLFKTVRFAIQGNVFLQQHEFITLLNELSTVAAGRDLEVFNRLQKLKNHAQVDLEHDTQLLFTWAKETLYEVKEDM